MKRFANIAQTIAVYLICIALPGLVLCLLTGIGFAVFVGGSVPIPAFWAGVLFVAPLWPGAAYLAAGILTGFHND